MKNKRKDIKLYNVLFPVWMLMLLPPLWLIVLPGNFIIDSLVLIICMHVFKTENKKHFYSHSILKIFGFGLLADVIGAAFLFLMLAVFEIGIMGDELYLTIPAIFISAVMIYVFNTCVSFREISEKDSHRFALTFAIATAPWTFLIPTAWLY